MKIAISATGKNITDQLNQRFGRCECFIIHDTETGKNEVVENAGRMASGGAGIATAKLVADQGVKVVITGSVGPKAFTALKAAGIEIYPDANGTVEEAIKMYKDNKLTETSAPTVGAHNGI